VTLYTDGSIKVYASNIEPTTYTADGWVVGHPTRGVVGTFALRDTSGFLRDQQTDITCDVERIAIRRGKSRGLESFGPGSCTLQLETTDNRYSPRNTTGIYSGGVGAQLFRRGTPITVVWESGPTNNIRRNALFSGWVDTIENELTLAGAMQHVTVTCTDAFDRLARFDQNALDSQVGHGDTFTQRLVRWCQASGVMGLNQGVFNETFNSTSGGVPLPHYHNYGVFSSSNPALLQSTDMADNALTAVKAAAASTGCEVFVRGDGFIATRQTPQVFASVPQWYISDDDTIETLSDHWVAHPGWPTNPTAAERSATFSGTPRVTQDEGSWRNVIRLARKGGTARQAVRGDLSTMFAVLERTDLVSLDDATVDTVAARMLAIYGRDFDGGSPTLISTQHVPSVDMGSLWLAISGELLDHVRFRSTRHNLTTNGWLIGIEHDIKPLGDWSMTLTTSEVP
jgi:hypothetical protein